ncbi:MAG: ThuA domain-containing protein [Candidatus Solibacter usitatus]|nr:ThuA domain-containing protein [Candidatus Solibacter usitatus]
MFCLTAAAQIAPVPDKFFFEEGKIRVLILTGRNNHDWRATTPYLREVLQLSGRFDVRVTEEPSGLSAATLKPYDVLISNYCGPRWGAPAEKAVEEFVSAGKGLVVVHAGSYPFGETAVLSERMGRTGVYQKPWTAWGKMVGAVWSDTEPRTGHAQRHAYQVTWEDKEHPIAAGMAGSFLLSDELYHNFRLKPGIHILATAFDSPKIGGNGKQEPLLWTYAYGKGRMFHTALGHDLDAMRTPGFTASYARGVEWAATGKVALPAVIDLNPKNKDAVRVLLVSGGHDHESSFYGVFENWRDILVNVDPHPVAFRNDLRKRYDVIVLYDTIQTEALPEKHRQNLRDFIESGKGLIILHHAIADFQSWEWWWKEVVGGRYVLKAEPGYEASKYLHDVELVVTPKPGHAITKGLPQMRLFDETYRQVWRRPDVQPLLTTDHSTSDVEIGWVSPYQKSRVVYLQPGHGRESHEQPWFRQLVRKSILWSAGR